MISSDPRSLPELISTLVSDFADLVRKEGRLVRAELSEKFAAAARGGVKLAAGGALLLGAFLTLLAAVVLALSKVMDPVWAALLVAVIAAAAGGVLVMAGVRAVRPSQLKPDRAARQVRKDIHFVKGQTQ
jgi:ABC-type uncharacterized transport system permease subunit